LAVVLTLELLWLLLVTASVMFLAAHLGPGSEEFTGDATVRVVLLVGVPPLAVVLGFALIGARQAVERSTGSAAAPVSRWRRLALWLSAGANAIVAISILTSLYHAQTTWLVVGLLIAVGLTTVAWACARTARYSVAMARRMSRLAARRAGKVPANKPASADRMMKTTI
jgi:hypothetical protein